MDNNIAIKITNLSRTFEKDKQNPGTNFIQKLKYYFKPIKEEIKALISVNLEVYTGEFIGLIGPNGAGKTTLVKHLTGILTPDSGSISCLDYIPYKQREEYVKNIGVVFGSRSILEYNIAVIESLRLYGVIYNLTDEEIENRIKYLSEMLDIVKHLYTPVRKLSLGERMRCELAASFMHKPKIVFLDEPTIGLDALAKEKIRIFLKEINKKENVTIVITTHDMDDIEELCKRIILINNGTKLYDGDLDKFKKSYVEYMQLSINYKSVKDLTKFNNLKKELNSLIEKGNYFEAQIKSNNIIPDLFDCLEIIDIKIEDEKLENIIKKVYLDSSKKGM